MDGLALILLLVAAPVEPVEPAAESLPMPQAVSRVRVALLRFAIWAPIPDAWIGPANYPSYPHNMTPEWHAAFKQVSRELDLAHDDEVWWGNWQSNVVWMRSSHRLDIPPSWDRFRFPLADAAHSSKTAAAHCEWLAMRQPLAWSSQQEYYDAWRHEAGRAWWAWQILHRIATSGCCMSQRIDLAALREHLGQDDYYAGRMPPPVPVHRFRSRD